MRLCIYLNTFKMGFAYAYSLVCVATPAGIKRRTNPDNEIHADIYSVKTLLSLYCQRRYKLIGGITRRSRISRHITTRGAV